MKSSFGVTSCIVQCANCGWRSESYKNAQANAAIHAKKYGHKVLVESTMGGYYDGSQ